MQADNPQTRGAGSPRPLAGGATRVGEHGERVGPLRLSRYLKDDGRALLLYRHTDDGQARGA